jgi:hypothetical protein
MLKELAGKKPEPELLGDTPTELPAKALDDTHTGEPNAQGVEAGG